MKIGIVGLGLIGGSIYKSLKQLNNYEVIGISSSIREEDITSDYSKLVDCELIFVCTPISATLETLDKLNSILTPDNIVTDVCSIKGFLTDKKYKYKFIPSHPMAGTENCGWENSFAGLFNGAKWAITSSSNEERQEQEVLESVIKDLGAEPIITTAEEHDRAVALISHMPLVLSQALCLNIKDNKLAQSLAASGFRDMTRLALSNPQMAEDMVKYNSENIKIAFELTEKSISKLLTDCNRTSIENLKSFRQNLY